jgi:hypothetical protein
MGSPSVRARLGNGLDVERAAAILFATCANETIFLRLIEECGWTTDEYAELIEKLMMGLLLAPDPRAA